MLRRYQHKHKDADISRVCDGLQDDNTCTGAIACLFECTVCCLHCPKDQHCYDVCIAHGLFLKGGEQNVSSR